MKNIYMAVICIVMMYGCQSNKSNTQKENTSNQVAKVLLKKENGAFKLYVNNQPFYIKGGGLEYGNIADLAKHKGNSFRTWRTDNGRQTATEVLDEAHKYGLMVTMGIEVARERHGFDYNDTIAVKKQLDRIKNEVLEIKDHPALLMWGIGNELNLRYKNDKVWDAVNEISKMIHSVDKNHLTTTSLAGISKKEIELINNKCDDLDVLSVQMYGDLPNLPKLVRDFGWEGAYMVTEWGATGHWEVPKTSWGAPIEENSTVKAANYLKRYQQGIEADTTQCIGSYVFLWGQKQERTPTWYGIFLEDGKETESVDVMHYVWNQSWPKNRSPQVESFLLDGKKPVESIELIAGKEYKAIVKILDLENDVINYDWELLPESTDLGDGGDFENKPTKLALDVLHTANGNLTFKAPQKGEYRLFLTAADGNNHAAVANIPFIVK